MKYRTMLVIQVLLIGAAVPPHSQSQEFSGNADLNYSYAAGEFSGDDTSSRRFEQQVALGVQHQMTKALEYTMDFRATRDMNRSNATRSEGKALYPSFSLNLNNRFLDGRLSYSRSETDKGDNRHISGDSWTTMVSAAYGNLPEVNMLYSHSSQSVSGEDRSGAGGDSERIDLNTDYRLGPFELLYTFSSTESKGGDREVNSRDRNHSGAGTFRRSLWQDRLTLGANYSRSHASSNRESSLGTQRFLDLLQPAAGLSSLDSTPTGGTLLNLPGLVDGIVTEDAGGIQIGGILSGGAPFRNIGVDLALPRRVTALYVYTSEIPEEIDFTRFTWDLYTSTDGERWNRFQANAPFDFDELQLRFEFEFPETQTRFIKVVNTAHDTRTSRFFVTEVEVFRLAGEGTNLETTSSAENLSLTADARITDRLTCSYAFRHDRTTSEPTGDTSSNQGHTANTVITVSPEFTARLQWSMQQNESPEAENETQTYSAQVAVDPFEEISYVLSFSHADTHMRSESGDMDNTQDSIHLNTIFPLYPGVDMQIGFLTLLYERSEGIPKTRSHTLNASASLDLMENLQAQFDYYYNWRYDEEEQTQRSTLDTGQDVSARINHRISRRLNLAGNFDYSEQGADVDFSSGVLLDCLLTNKMQLSLTGNHRSGTQESYDLSSQFSWDISRRFVLLMNYAYTRSEDPGGSAHTAGARFSGSF